MDISVLTRSYFFLVVSLIALRNMLQDDSGAFDKDE